MKVHIIDDVRDVPRQLFLGYKVKSPFHDPHLWSTISKCSNIRMAVIESDTDACFTLFKIKENTPYAECLISGSPFAGEIDKITVEQFQIGLDSIADALGKILYFPLIYKGDLSGELLLKAKALSWERLPSPVVYSNALKKGLVERAAERIGSRANRRIRRFQASGTVVRQVVGKEAMQYIKIIEKASWKAPLNQDMFSRDQDLIYSALTESTNTLVRVALLEGQPISYRLDYKAGTIIYSLKWSFVEKYRRLSPGFYLLTKDLSDCWGNIDIEYIDLHGSSDSLKLAICDIAFDRFRRDFSWPAYGELVKSLKHDRLEHDRRLIENVQNGHGTRSLYQ